jgi:hypothetical protein
MRLDGMRVMAVKLITCPESAHLEQIEYMDTPLGLLIHRCSRFEPACTVSCARECAARLDRKRRLSEEFDEMPTLDLDVGDDTDEEIDLDDRRPGLSFNLQLGIIDIF